MISNKRFNLKRCYKVPVYCKRLDATRGTTKSGYFNVKFIYDKFVGNKKCFTFVS